MDSRHLCKAKVIDSKKWIEGFYVEHRKKTLYADDELSDDDIEHLIMCDNFSDWGMPRELNAYKIDPATLCRCTGLKDENNKLIWENDILHNGNYFVVKWNAPCARFDIVLNNSCNIPIGKWEPIICDWKTNDFKEYRKAVDYEIIGNIFDNPELLKREKTYCKDDNDYER